MKLSLHRASVESGKLDVEFWKPWWDIPLVEVIFPFLFPFLLFLLLHIFLFSFFDKSDC